jgi:tRNA A-37 threonylcarbamoyl transferase component Bud32
MNGKLTIDFHIRASEVLGVVEGDLPELAKRLLDDHAEIVRKGGKSLLKNAPESAVTLVSRPDIPRVCVKEFRRRGALHSLKSAFRATQALRSFTNGARLAELGVGVALPLALIRRIRFRLPEAEWMIMEAPAEALELDRFILAKSASRWSYSEAKTAAGAFGRFMGALHGGGVFHSDLKTCNVLVSESGGSEGTADPAQLDFRLLDYDDVEFGATVAEKRKVKNLAQLFLSCPSIVGAKLKLRFMRDYASASGLDSSRRKRIVHRTLEVCKGKRILYVGFQGDVVESWDCRGPNP